ncbi:MAG: histidine phosphatase family protein [Roseiflexaceae bacterium]
MQLYLVRHGETDYNAVGRYQGHIQIELNRTGHYQASLVCRRLAKFNHITAIYSSDLVRCIQTITPLADGLNLPVSLMPDLREIDVGLWEHLTIPEISASFPTNYATYQQAPGETVHVGGESYQHLQTRAMRALNHIIASHHADDHIVIASHGGTIRAIVCAIIGLDINHYNKLWVMNCAITTLTVTHGTVRLASFNDVAHIELEPEADREQLAV